VQKRLLILVSLLLLVSGCKLDFVGDLYTSDLVDLANSNELKNINLPMEISYQVASCEQADETNRMISTYFLEHKNTGCSIGEDFMSYSKAQVSVPVLNDHEAFKKTNNSLIGFVSYLSEDKKYVYVDAAINSQLYKSLQNYVYNQTFQEISLADSNLSVRLNNDLNSAIIAIQSSFVNKEPIIFEKQYKLKRRELLIIKTSNVTTSHLEINLWTPILTIFNNQSL